MSRCVITSFYFLFFKQKTAYEMRMSDWSSDVCSSDLDADRDRRGVAARLRCRRQQPVPEDDAGGRALSGADGRRQSDDQRRPARQDRQSVVAGKSVSVRDELGGRRNIKKTTTHINSRKLNTTKTVT